MCSDANLCLSICIKVERTPAAASSLMSEKVEMRREACTHTHTHTPVLYFHYLPHLAHRGSLYINTHPNMHHPLQRCVASHMSEVTLLTAARFSSFAVIHGRKLKPHISALHSN